MVWISWGPGQNSTLDTEAWQADAHGWVATMINNDSYYLAGQRALAMELNNGTNGQMIYATKVSNTMYTIYYEASIDNLSQFQVMVASFHPYGTYSFFGNYNGT